MAYERWALKLFGKTLRIAMVKGNKAVAVLEFTPARRVRVTAKRGGRSVEGEEMGVAVELRIIDADAFNEALYERENGTYSVGITVLTPARARAVAFGLLHYADLVELASLMGYDHAKLRDAWFKMLKGAKGRKKARKAVIGRSGSRSEPEPEEAPEPEPELEEEEEEPIERNDFEGVRE